MHDQYLKYLINIIEGMHFSSHFHYSDPGHGTKFCYNLRLGQIYSMNLQSLFYSILRSWNRAQQKLLDKS